MNIATPQIVDSPLASATPDPAPRRGISASACRPTWADVLKEAVPMIDSPAFYGPPVIVVLGPWLLLVLLLAGPFALLITMVLALAAAAALIAVTGAMIASPYLLIRQLRARRTAGVRPRARRHGSRTDRLGPGRLASPQPKGVP
jgi:hypothetical protein